MGEAAKKEYRRWIKANFEGTSVLLATVAVGGVVSSIFIDPIARATIDNPRGAGMLLVGGAVLSVLPAAVRELTYTKRIAAVAAVAGSVLCFFPNEGYASKSDYDALKEKYAALAGTNTTTTTRPGQTTTSQPHGTEAQTSVASSQPSAPDKVINIPTGFSCSPVAGVVVEKGEGPWALIDRTQAADTATLTGIFRANPALREMSLDAGDVVSITCG